MLAKADLASRINDIIRQRGLTQVEAATVLGVNQPRVSALKRGRLTEFSLEGLMKFLIALGQEIHITVRPATRAGFRVFNAGGERQR